MRRGFRVAVEVVDLCGELTAARDELASEASDDGVEVGELGCDLVEMFGTP